MVNVEGGHGVGDETSEAFASGMVLDGGFELDKAIACSNGSSEVWLASKVFTGEGVVVKRILHGNDEAFERERAVLKFLQRHGAKGGSQHSIPFVGVVPSLYCLVLGRGTRNLRQIGQRFYQRCTGNTAAYVDRVRPYARQVVEICQWLHRLGVVWGDVKPENFVEGQDGDLKAVDFDSACAIVGGIAAGDRDVVNKVGCHFERTHVFTLRYCAPERVQAFVKGGSFPATKAADVWSVGMVLFWLLTGQASGGRTQGRPGGMGVVREQDYLEEGLTDSEVVTTLCSPGFAVSLAGIDPKQEQARNVLRMMLRQEPAQRGTADTVLCRAFFAGGATISAVKLQAEMAASLRGVSLKLAATIREEGGSTRVLLDQSMKRLEARAEDILGKLGRMDCMLESLVDGNIDCPRLFILTPKKESPALWKPDTWFSDSNVLTFLCAHDLTPIGEGIKVPCPRMMLEKRAPAIQASAFVLKLGCKAACMTAGVTPAAIDGMSAALGANFLAGQQVAVALRSAAGNTLGEADNGENKLGIKGPRSRRGSLAENEPSEAEHEGKRLTGEAYEALVAFLDKSEPSWRATLKRDMVQVVRGDGKVSWICHEHVAEWKNSSMPVASDPILHAVHLAADIACGRDSTTVTMSGDEAESRVRSAGSQPLPPGTIELPDRAKASSGKPSATGPGILSKLKRWFGRRRGSTGSGGDRATMEKGSCGAIRDAGAG